MTIGRRQFLASTLVAPALMTRRAFAWSPDAPVLERPFARATKEGEGLYITLANPAGGPQCLSNGGVLAGRDAVLLIEGHMQPAGATFELDLARLVSNRPIRGAVNTHFHPDHAFGDSAYAAAKVAIIAQDTAPALIKSKVPGLEDRGQGGAAAPLSGAPGRRDGRGRDQAREGRHRRDAVDVLRDRQHGTDLSDRAPVDRQAGRRGSISAVSPRCSSAVAGTRPPTWSFASPSARSCLSATCCFTAIPRLYRRGHARVAQDSRADGRGASQRPLRTRPRSDLRSRHGARVHRSARRPAHARREDDRGRRFVQRSRGSLRGAGPLQRVPALLVGLADRRSDAQLLRDVEASDWSATVGGATEVAPYERVALPARIASSRS